MMDYVLVYQCRLCANAVRDLRIVHTTPAAIEQILADALLHRGIGVAGNTYPALRMHRCTGLIRGVLDLVGAEPAEALPPLTAWEASAPPDASGGTC